MNTALNAVEHRSDGWRMFPELLSIQQPGNSMLLSQQHWYQIAFSSQASPQTVGHGGSV